MLRQGHGLGFGGADAGGEDGLGKWLGNGHETWGIPGEFLGNSWGLVMWYGERMVMIYGDDWGNSMTSFGDVSKNGRRNTGKAWNDHKWMYWITGDLRVITDIEIMMKWWWSRWRDFMGGLTNIGWGFNGFVSSSMINGCLTWGFSNLWHSS